MEQKLCVLLLMLQSTGRENKETLKVFRDSGHYTSFFPQDDPLIGRISRSVLPRLCLIQAAPAPPSTASTISACSRLGTCFKSALRASAR